MRLCPACQSASLPVCFPYLSTPQPASLTAYLHACFFLPAILVRFSGGGGGKELGHYSCVCALLGNHPIPHSTLSLQASPIHRRHNKTLKTVNQMCRQAMLLGQSEADTVRGGRRGEFGGEEGALLWAYLFT